MSGARKLGLFGGSFDPIHRGHVEPVQAARRQLGLERVIYLPTARPPHKPKQELAAAQRRYAMVELALLREEGLYVSDHEVTLGRPAYTVETVEHFAERWPDDVLHLLVGSDSFAELDTWHRWRDLVEMVELVVMARPGWNLPDIRPELPPEIRRREEAGAVHVVTDVRVDVSSTDLRRRLARGEEPSVELLPELVVDYIAKYSLYR